jgi:hypothetical protein
MDDDKVSDAFDTCPRPLRQIIQALAIPDADAPLRRYNYPVSIPPPERGIPHTQLTNYMSTVAISFMVRGHPFILDIENWAPVREDPPFNLEPVFQLFTKAFGDRLTDCGPHSEEESAIVLFCVGSALRYLHSRNLWHGSVDADHVFVGPVDDLGLVGRLAFASVMNKPECDDDLCGYKTL